MNRLERALASASSNVKYRQSHFDLDAEVKFLTTDDVRPDGRIDKAPYRGPFHARRHLLMDDQMPRIRSQYHRAFRRWSAADLREQLADMDTARQLDEDEIWSIYDEQLAEMEQASLTKQEEIDESWSIYDEFLRPNVYGDAYYDELWMEGLV